MVEPLGLGEYMPVLWSLLRNSGCFLFGEGRNDSLTTFIIKAEWNLIRTLSYVIPVLDLVIEKEKNKSVPQPSLEEPTSLGGQPLKHEENLKILVEYCKRHSRDGVHANLLNDLKILEEKR